MADQVNKNKDKDKDKQSSLDSFITQTPKAGLKRTEPSSSPDISSPSMLQAGKKIMLDSEEISKDSDISELELSKSILSSYVQNETIVKLSEVVCATLKNDEFINSLIPVITQRVMEHVQPTIKAIVDECIKPYIAEIKSNKEDLLSKEAEIAQQNDQINILKDSVERLERNQSKIEARIEEQEQYSRRTSLRFYNVPVPTNEKGEIIQPIDTDKLVLNICKNDLHIDFSLNDIGRSHPIGEMRDGKISIIVRFLSYRQRHLVYMNKKKLKGNPSKIFIAENMTRHRYDLLYRLNSLRLRKKIDSFWTHDGTILVKETPSSRPRIIKTQQDVQNLI